jgi:predicted component of type VI protein secretion system
MLYATATAAEHATQRQSTTADDDWDALTRALREADPRVHPRIARLAPLLVSGEPHDRFVWGLRTLLTGVTRTPIPGAAGPVDR